MAADYNERDDSKAVQLETPNLSPSLQGHLGRQLRAAYSELIDEPIPDRFSKLLEELASTQSENSPKGEE